MNNTPNKAGNTPEETLHRYFPHLSAFRDRQREVIERLVQGESLLYLAPTGSGKSLSYQVAGLIRGGLTVVISPLRALIHQQGLILERLGIPTTVLHAGIEPRKQFELLRSLLRHRHQTRFLFISPERAFTDGFLEYVLQRLASQIGLIVIDEAHCVSQWGHSFRPAYRGIPHFLERIFSSSPQAPLLCLTATLNPKEEQDICTEFRIPPASTLRSAKLYRTNLTLEVERHEDEHSKVKRL
ncbi:MAG: DEAD/DEAH box helicase, partial [Candidatus Sumerlaeia bacterium]|nr:DEAD/DEAH box helicase [Candidatus Sumerlaeia bacterium]